jgi:hypothetical protein
VAIAHPPPFCGGAVSSKLKMTRIIINNREVAIFDIQVTTGTGFSAFAQTICDFVNCVVYPECTSCHDLK